MIKRFMFAVFFMALCVPSFSLAQLNLKVEVEGYEGDTLFLGYYFGKGKYFYDTARVDEGQAVFQNEESAPQGIYVLFDPETSKYHDVILGEDQEFTLFTNSRFDFRQVRFEGNQENADFYNYIKLVSELKPVADSIRQLPQGDPAYERLVEMNQEVQQLQQDLIEKYPNDLAGLTIKSGLEMDFPDFQGNEDEIRRKQFYYYKAHYFDDIDLTDDRLLRTSFLFPKIDQYISKVVPQQADSLIKAVDLILQGMNPDAPESFRYFLVHFLNKYAKSKIVGMDAVYVHLVKEYYAKGYADWVDQEKLDKIIEEADRIAPTLIGKKAPEMMIQNLKTDEKFSIYDIESDYTILYFWDPDCGHCKKTTPKVIDFYKTYKDSSISIVAICTKLNTDAKPKCLEYIEGKKDMDLFINAFDPFLRSRYKQKYDIRSTPKVYILDKDKNILLKNIGGEQLKEVMDQVLSQNRADQKSQIK